MAMNYINDLLQYEEIRQLCAAALWEESQLDAALEAIFRKGFEDIPYVEGVEKAFVQRLHQIQQFVPEQMERYQKNPDTWEQEQLALAEDPDALVCSLTALSAWLHGSNMQRREVMNLLEQRMKLAPAETEENRRLLHAFAASSSQALFVGGRVPSFPERMIPQVAAILAMCSYVSVKQEPTKEIHPDLSFDAVCIWSITAAQVLCRKPEQRPEPERAATVASVLAARKMHTIEWSGLLRCVLSLAVLSYPVIILILKIIRKWIVPALNETPEVLEEQWVDLEKPQESVQPLINLLDQQVRSLQTRKADGIVWEPMTEKEGVFEHDDDGASEYE